MPPKASSSTNAVQNASNAISPDHLSHPERWATGAEPATKAQVGFIGVLENQKHLEVGEERKAEMGKSEASEIIDGLKHGRVLPPSEVDAPGAPPPTDSKRKRGSDTADKETSESKAIDSKIDEEDGKKDADEEKKEEDAVEEKGDGKGEEKTEEKKESNGDSDTSKPVKKSTSTAKASSSSTEDTPSAPKKAKTSPTKSAASDDAPKGTSNEDDAEEAKSSEDSSKNGGKEIPNLPGDAAAPSEDHLAHPESWATGDDPATEKQLGYIAVLEKKNGSGSAKEHENLGKSKASELIEELKGGQ